RGSRRYLRNTAPTLSDRFCRFAPKACRAAVSAANSGNGVSPKRPTMSHKTFRGQIRAGAVVFTWFILPPIAVANWQVVSRQRESSTVAGVEHRHVVMQNSSDESATIDLAAFSTRTATLHLIDNPGGSENLADLMGHENFIAGVNGGYFDA